MRTWMMAVACTWAAGCVVYKDGSDWQSSSSSSSSSSTTWQPEEGEVEIGWRVGSTGCEAGGVEEVEVDLGGIVHAFPCTDEHAVVSAPVGRHPLVLRGLDVDGVPRYEGDGGEVRIRRNEIASVPTVVLAALPARIEVAWYFDNGRLCSQNGIEEIELDLFDENDTLQVAESIPCEEGQAALAEVEAGPYVLLLLGRDGQGEVRYSGREEIEAGRGDRIRLDTMLAPEG